MKTSQLLFILIYVNALSIVFGQIPAFDSGSDGSDGALEVTENTTLQVPEDGIFNFTTITIESGTLTFTPNSNNTPIYLLATGDVLIQGQIDVSGTDGSTLAPGRGGPGGFDGGYATSVESELPGDGSGPGRGLGQVITSGSGVDIHASHASLGTGATENSTTYGNVLCMPLIGGSGGGAYRQGTPNIGAGGGGGGAILIASSTRISIKPTIVMYNIRATGGSGFGSGGSGSGGTIRLVAPDVDINGVGILDLSGGSRAGHGRIRIDTFDKGNIDANRTIPLSALTIGTNMQVFPEVLPRVSILQVGDDVVPQGSAAFITQPSTDPETQDVTIQVEDFGTVVPLSVVLTPELGPSTTYDLDIDNTTENPATGSVSVNIPAGVVVRIHCWTR